MAKTIEELRTIRDINARAAAPAQREFHPDKALPGCMMPDGGECCGGYQALLEDWRRLRALAAPVQVDGVREACDWPNEPFRFADDPGEHDPCYVIMPDGAMIPFNHHAGEGVDIARATFIMAACNAALANGLPLSPMQIQVIVTDAMQECWNDICSDTGCHPLDIEQLRGKRLEFHVGHWARQTGARVAAALSQGSISDQGASETSLGQCLLECRDFINQLNALGRFEGKEVSNANELVANADIALAALEGMSRSVERQNAPADDMIGEIEKRFPDWKSYRDLADCIDVTLHRLRGGS